DPQLPGHLGNGQRPRIVEHQLVVEWQPRQRPRRGAGSDDHMLRGERFGVLAAGLDLPRPGAAASEAAAAMEERYLVLLEEIHDAVVVLAHHLVLALQHLRE